VTALGSQQVDGQPCLVVTHTHVTRHVLLSFFIDSQKAVQTHCGNDISKVRCYTRCKNPLPNYTSCGTLYLIPCCSLRCQICSASAVYHTDQIIACTIKFKCFLMDVMIPKRNTKLRCQHNADSCHWACRLWSAVSQQYACTALVWWQYGTIYRHQQHTYTHMPHNLYRHGKQ